MAPNKTYKTFYDIGESVFALWPGSGGLYFKGVIVAFNPVDRTYDVKFEEGTTYTLLKKHVSPVDSFRALEPKSAQRGEKKTRGQQRSGSRSRSRSRTPGRKPRGKSPANESNYSVRTSSRQSSIKNESKIKQSPETEFTNLKVKMESKEDGNDSTSSTRRSPKVRLAKKFYGTVDEEESWEDMRLSRRKSSRLATKTKESTPVNQLDNDVYSDEGSSNEMSIKPKGNEQTKDAPITNDVASGLQMSTGNGEQIEPLSSFTATLTTIFLGNLPLALFLYLICKENKCLFEGMPRFAFADLLSMYNPFVSFCIESFYLAIFLLSMLPTGKVVKIGEGKLFRRNSIVSAIIMISSLLAIMHYLKISASSILTHFPQFVIPNFAVSFVFAFVVSFRERHNRHSDTGILSHFVFGSSLNATIANVNVKVWVHRAVFITVIALNCLVLVANFEKNQVLSPTLAFVAAMQMIFALEALWNDTHLFHSFDFNHVKIGWMYLTMNTYPLATFLITLSAINSGLELSYLVLAPIGILFLIGLWIKAGSNSQLAAFIENPEHTSFSNMENLTSSSGKLLISGWWGWLRHPNFLGDIIMHWAFVLPCGYGMFLPYAVAIFATVCFVYRTKESDLAGKLKYGPSWDRYCQRVPSRVIPRVF